MGDSGQSIDTAALVGARHNAAQICSRVSHELFTEIMTYLPILNLVDAAKVCQAWRQHLKHTPLLWNNIALHLQEPGDVTLLPDILRVLLERSGQVPLTVQLSLEGHDPSFFSNEPVTHRGMHPMEVYDSEVPKILMAEMYRMRSLSLKLWYWSGSDWGTLFTTPAPALERFRLAGFNEDPEPLPTRLFGDVAANLKSVYLDWVYLPPNPGQVLNQITSLYYACPDGLETVPRLKGLRDLTIGSRVDQDALSQWEMLRGASLDRVQLWNDELTPSLLGRMSNIGHICYSLSLMQSSLDGDYTELSHVLHHVRSVAAKSRRSIEVGPRRFLLPEISISQAKIGGEPTFALRLDGQDIVVDIIEQDLEEFLSDVPITSYVHGIQVLAIPATLWDIFDTSCLLTLRELTLYIQACNDWATEQFMPVPDAGSLKHNITLLRLACFYPDPEHPASTPLADFPEIIPLLPVWQFMCGSIVPQALKCIVLDGITFSTEERDFLCEAVPNVAFENSCGFLKEDACAQWKWFFPDDDAFPA